MKKTFFSVSLAAGLLFPLCMNAQDTVPAQPAEVAPAEVAPVEAAPAKTAPAQTAPVEVAPAQTAPAQTAPVEVAPAQTAPAQTAPAEAAPAKTAPAQTAPVETAAPAAPLTKAKLFAILPKEFCVTPDCFVHTPWGDGSMLLSCPNFADPTMPRIILSISKDDQIRLWGMFPGNPNYKISTEPGKYRSLSGPMGMDFGPDGNLYVVDNIGWYGDPFADDPEFQMGRLVRIIVKNQRPVGAEVVAYNMSHPNDVKVRGDKIYVSHSMIAKEGEGENQTLISGVYCFPLDAKNVKVNNTVNDPQLICTVRTTPPILYGLDGICFGNDGEMYLGNFGQGSIEKVTFDENGKVAKQELFAQGPEMLTNDGMWYDQENGHIYVCDFSRNAILDIDKEGKIRVLAQDPDSTGEDGSLDQPAALILRGKQLIISNFDNVTGEPHTNTAHDDFCTLSVVDLDGIVK